jgi:hypothetical protein
VIFPRSTAQFEVGASRALRALIVAEILDDVDLVLARIPLQRTHNGVDAGCMLHAANVRYSSTNSGGGA